MPRSAPKFACDHARARIKPIRPSTAYFEEFDDADYFNAYLRYETRGAGATQRYAYGPYGEPDAWGNSSTHARFRYTGQAALPEIGLYHYKARVYDPMLGRFLQTDPIRYGDDLHPYGYVRNDPINALDPTGLETHILSVQTETTIR